MCIKKKNENKSKVIKIVIGISIILTMIGCMDHPEGLLVKIEYNNDIESKLYLEPEEAITIILSIISKNYELTPKQLRKYTITVLNKRLYNDDIIIKTNTRYGHKNLIISIKDISKAYTNCLVYPSS